MNNPGNDQNLPEPPAAGDAPPPPAEDLELIAPRECPDCRPEALDPLGAPAERVVVELPRDVPAALVDAAQIERALVNLIENALKFSSSKDPVTLTVDRRDDSIVIGVRDRGPGIAPAQLGRIFEPFERGAAGSTGLGLSIARGFAQANGGRVEVDSRAGEGSTFSLVLPRADVPAQVRA